MYLTDGNYSTMFRVDLDAGTATSSPTHYFAYPIAITDTIRLGHRNNAEGREYDLDGNPTGVEWGPGPLLYQFLDGTTDGATYNYAVACCGSDAVYRYDRFWGNGELLFNIGNEGGKGITYDPVNNTLWVMHRNGILVQFSLNGDVITSSSAFAGNRSLEGLSYDARSDSFWLYNTVTTFYNIDRDANILRSVEIPGLVAYTVFGGEIRTAVPTVLTVTPMPTTVVRGGTVRVAAEAVPGEGPAPTGTITISSGSASCEIASSAGACDLTLSELGPQTVTATFTPADVGIVRGSTAQAAVTTTCPAITLTPASLPASRAGEPYSVAFTASGGIAPHTFGITGALPEGLTLTGDTLSGTPAGEFNGSVTVRATESGGGCNGEQAYALTIEPAEPPEPTTREYTLAEAVTDDFFASFILIANPNASEAPVTLRYAGETGVTATETRTLAPFSRMTIATGVGSVAETVGTAFMTRITSDAALPLLIERATYFDATLHAGDLSAASEGAGGTTRYFAEGANGYFHTYLLLGNPSDDEAASVTVRYLPESGAAVERAYTVAPHSRATIDTIGEPALAGTFAIALQASLPIAADRVQYFGSPFAGAHADGGTAAPADDWYFAEGASGSAWDTYLLLANPSADPASVTVTYHTDLGEAVARTHTVGAGARLTIGVETEDPRLASSTFWIEVHADRPIVAERAMYVVGESGWTDATATTGLTAPGLRWGFAEGANGLSLGYLTYVLIANPSAQTANVTVQYLRATGEPLSRDYTLAAGSRLTLDVGHEEPSLADTEFGIVVSSTNDTPIIVERSQYWTLGQPRFVGAMNTTGTPLPASVIQP